VGASVLIGSLDTPRPLQQDAIGKQTTEEKLRMVDRHDALAKAMTEE
jgi:hypothetical protein